MRLLGSLTRNIRDWNSPLGTMAVRGVGMAMNFAALALNARWVGPASLGSVIAVNSAAFLGGVLCSAGLSTLLLREITGDLMRGNLPLAAARYYCAVRRTLVISGGALLLAFAFGTAQWRGILPARIGTFGPMEVFSLGLCTLGLATQSLGLGVVRALKHPALSGVFQFCTMPVMFVLILLGLRATQSVITPTQTLAALVLATGANTIAVNLFVSRRLGRAGTTETNLLPWAAARALWSLNVLSAASANSLVLLGAYLLSPERVAVIGVPFRICNLPMTVVTAMGAYYSPLIREAHLQGDHPRLRRELRESQWLGGAVVVPVLLLALFLPKTALSWFAIHDASASNVFLIFAIAQTLIAGCGVAEQYLAMLDRTKVAVRITQFSLLGTVVAVALLARPISPLALGLAWSLFGVLRQVSLLWACRTIHLPAPSRAAANP